MTIKVGDQIPEGKFRVMTAEGPGWKTTDEVFKGKKVVLFAVPGAFTPTCHKNHLPGFLQNAAAIKGKGIDAIAVTAVNDVFVMTAWKDATGAEGKIEFLADGNGDFAKAIDLTMDGSAGGLGLRSKRYSMLVENGVVKKLNIEEAPGKAETSGADALLKQLYICCSAFRRAFKRPARMSASDVRAAIAIFRASAAQVRSRVRPAAGHDLVHGFVGELIGALVEVVAGMAAHPVPADLVARGGGIEPLPQVGILDRLACRRSASRCASTG